MGDSQISVISPTKYLSYSTNFGIQSEPALCVVNPAIKRMRAVNYATYAILLVSAPIFLIIYGILLSKMPLNLEETGNSWTFILFLTTCCLVIILSIRIVTQHRAKFPLRWKHVVVFDMFIIACWTGLLMVCIGVMEQVQDRSKCHLPGAKCSKHHAPKVPTTFGIYVAGVCGRNLTESNLEGALAITSPYQKNAEKCTATKLLKTEIYCMYIWTGELFILSFIESLFGLGSWRRRNVQEYLNPI